MKPDHLNTKKWEPAEDSVRVPQVGQADCCRVYDQQRLLALEVERVEYLNIALEKQFVSQVLSTLATMKKRGSMLR